MGPAKREYASATLTPRRPVYGNSIFSDGQSVYRTGDANDNIADFPFEPGTAKGSGVAQPASGGQDEDGNPDNVSETKSLFYL